MGRVPGWWPVLAGAAALVGYLLALKGAGLTLAALGGLWDPDAYARLLRVEQLHDRGGWYDATLAALNHPDGLPMHWTRPLDVLLLVGARGFEPFHRDFHTALAGWGDLVSPVLGIATVAWLWWGTRPLALGWAFAVAMLAWPVQRGLLYAFSFGRPDHHSLLFMLLAALLAALWRDALAPSRRLTALAGGLAAIAIWVSVEGLMTFALGGLVLAAQAAHRPERRAGFHAYLVATAIGLAVALVIERPPGQWLAVEYDRLSIVHLVLAATMAATAPLLRGENLPLRLAGLALPGVAAAAVMALSFPDFFKGPLVGMSDLVRSVQFEGVSENQPLLPDSPVGVFNWITELGQVLLAVVFTLARLRWAPPQWRAAYLCNALGLLVFLPYALLMLRNAMFVQVFTLLPLVDVVQLVARRRAVLLGAMAALVVAAPAAAAVGMAKWRVGGLYFQAPSRCQYERLEPFVAEAKRALSPGAAIMAVQDDAPEVAWRFGMPAIGGNYHRNDPGIRDSLRFFASPPPDAVAFDIAKRRRVGLVVLCDASSRTNRADSLQGRLRRRQPPSWLVEVPIAPELERGFALYRLRSR